MTQKEKIPKVLFVCLGNIIRSQLAHAIMHHLLAKENLQGQIFVDSAGTIQKIESNGPDSRTIQILEERGIEHFSYSRKIQDSDYEYFNYILVMDKMNFEDVIENKPKNLQTPVLVRFLRDFDKQKDSDEVLDPYYGNKENFEEAYQTIYRCTDGLLSYLKKQYQLKPNV